MKQYWVTVVRYGGVDIEAESEEAAMQIVDTQVKTQDVNWSDDWEATDAEEEVDY